MRSKNTSCERAVLYINAIENYLKYNKLKPKKME